MSSLNKIVSLLQNQSFPIMEKTVEQEIETKKILLQNGVRKDSGFLKLSTKYFLRLLDTREGNDDIVDPLPTRNFIDRNNFIHKVWKIPEKYILITTIEGEGGYLYNTEDDSVWDFNLGQQQELLNGTLPHWNSFYEFMEWYLDTSEEED